MYLRNLAVERRGESKQLVVIVHGFVGTAASLKDVRAEVANSLPDADLLVPEYAADIFSGLDPSEISMSLASAINDAVIMRPNTASEYGIILIGHSVGALLVRKAYVYARGESEDNRGPPGFQPQGFAWCMLVERVILLAGTCRGWSIEKKVTHLSWPKWIGFFIAASVWRWFGFSRLANSVRRGAPFVTNLRIQWINLSRHDATPLPTTIQLLGTVDDIVSEDDNVDIQCGRNFVYRRVEGAGHANVVRFSEPGGDVRKREFVYALITERHALESCYLQPPEVENRVKDVVFIMHGIRDFGYWTRRLAAQISEESKAPDAVAVIRPAYGWFPMLDFLLLGERQKNVRWFMDEYVEALARYPHAEFNFIGHSNGTYLLASALDRYKAAAFKRVAFLGSVVSRKYPWQTCFDRGQVTHIRNYVATKDWVVAIFPALFQHLPSGDLGDAGFTGFAEDGYFHNSVEFFVGSHNAGIEENNFVPLAKFILGDDNSRNPALEAIDQSFLVIIANRLCWLIWILLILTVISPVLLWSFGFITAPWWAICVLWPGLVLGILKTI